MVTEPVELECGVLLPRIDDEGSHAQWELAIETALRDGNPEKGREANPILRFDIEQTGHTWLQLIEKVCAN